MTPRRARVIARQHQRRAEQLQEEENEHFWWWIGIVVWSILGAFALRALGLA